MTDPLDTTVDPIESLLADCLLQPAGMRAKAIEQACADHPRLANQLRSRWRALQAAGLDTLLPASSDVPEYLGDFRLIEPLGGGGMGIVYLAEQRSLGREVALKIMRPDGMYFPDAHERFRREVEAIARLEHPGIVKVHSFGEEDGVPYFAMERIDGLTLADVLRSLAERSPTSLSGDDLRRAVGGGEAELFRMSWTDACAEIGRRVAVALHYSHDQGILHRDIKPSNIALTRDGRVQLFDFGLAASTGVERITRSGGQLGTLRYMPPEQLLGDRELDGRSDVYALGVTVYELVALQAPFSDESRTAVESRILAGRPAPLRTLNRRTPLELERVIARAMEVDRARRYATAAELADELQRVIERRPVSARPPGPILRARRWAQRHPALAVALLAAVGLFGVAPSVLLWRERAHSSELTESLRKETEALAAERIALSESLTSFRFVERLLFATDPYSTNQPDATARDILAAGVAELQSLEGVEESPRLEGRLALGLAYACWTRSLFAEALPLAERALEIESTIGEELLVNGVRPLHVVAETLTGMNRIPEAAERLAATLGSDATLSREYRGRLHFLLGTAQYNLGQFEPSVHNLETALEIFTPPEGPNAEPNMVIRQRLSGALSGLGRNEEALELVEPTIEIARDFAGDSHPAVAEGLTCTAHVLAGLGDAESAVDLQAEATDIIDDFYGVESFPGVRFHGDLSLLLAQKGDDAGALREADVAVRGSRAVFPPGDVRIGTAERWRESCRRKLDGAR